MWAAWTGLGLLAALAIAIVVYVVDLNFRSTVNSAGLECGLASRSRQKYRTGPARELWSLTTNLCDTCVGGPGLLLYFNFLATVPRFKKAVAAAAAAACIFWIQVCANYSRDFVSHSSILPLLPKHVAVLQRRRSQVIVWSAAVGLAWVIVAYVAARGTISSHTSQKRVESYESYGIQ